MVWFDVHGTVASYGLSHPIAAIAQCIDGVMSLEQTAIIRRKLYTFGAREDAGSTVLDDILYNLLGSMGFDVDAHRLYRAVCRHWYVGSVEFMPGVQRLFKALTDKGVPIGFATDATYPDVMRFECAMNDDIEYSLTASCYSGDEKIERGFWYDLTRHCNPTKSLYIGDSYERDVKPAKEAGFNAIWITPEPCEHVEAYQRVADIPLQRFYDRATPWKGMEP